VTEVICAFVVGLNAETIAMAQTPPHAVSFAPNESWTSGPYYGSMGTFFADVDGDGRSDAIALNPSTVTVRRSNGTSFSRSEDWTHGPYSGTRGTFFADVTGDHWADAIVVNDDTVTVRRAGADCFIGCWNYGFRANEDWTSGPYYGSTLTTFADVTGDGRADAVVINGSIVTVRRSDGQRFLANETWATGFTPGEVGTYFFDVDYDGSADLIAVNRGSIIVRASSGSAFGPATDWTGNAWFPAQTPGLMDVAFAQFYWFGGSSAMIYVSNQTVNVFPTINAAGQSRYAGAVSTSTPFVAFGSPLDFTGGPYYGTLGTFFADVDGDGSADAIVVNTNNVTVRPARP